MRKLVTIRTVNSVAPIEGADAIECLTIDGWKVVSKKGEFQAGSLCCYHEIDSLLPCKEPYTFLEKNGRKKMVLDGKEIEGYRLRTVKLRGQISQGLALPLSCFPGISETVGDDVTEFLGVEKYEPPIPAEISGEAVGHIPSCIPVTDEERIQNLPEIFVKYENEYFYTTEKVDGTSSTMYKLNGHFGACGHNWEYSEVGNNSFWQLAKRYDIVNKLPEGIAIQGETAGEGIQKNRLLLKGIDFFMFHAFKIDTGTSLELEEMEDLAKVLGIKMVPVIDREFSLKGHTVDSILEYASRMSLLNPTRPLEGVVFRMVGAKYKMSFKAISNKYLLGEKD